MKCRLNRYPILSFLVLFAFIQSCANIQYMGSHDEFLAGCSPEVEIFYDPGDESPKDLFLRELYAVYGSVERGGKKDGKLVINQWINRETNFKSVDNDANPLLCIEDKVILILGRDHTWKLEFDILMNKSNNPYVSIEFVDYPSGHRDLWRFRINEVKGYSESKTTPSYKDLLIKLSIIKNCNLRLSPSANSRILSVVHRGISLQSIEQRGQWHHVLYKDLDGWVHQACTVSNE